MDTLDRIMDAAGPLLARVDEIVEYAGAPGDHPVWRELRRIRLLPGDAVEAVATLRPDAVLTSLPALHTARETLSDVASALPHPDSWAGPAAEAYEARRAGLATHVDELAGRAAATAEFGADLAEWMRTTRREVAATLADVLSSAESVTLPVHDGGPVELLPAAQLGAAADMATLVLRTIGDAFAAAGPLLDQSVGLADAAR